MTVPVDISVLTRCPKCKRQINQVKIRADFQNELLENRMELYCGHCDLAWQGSDAEKNRAQSALRKGAMEII